MNEITELLAAAHNGDRQASEALLPLVYQELRKLAAARLRSEKPGQTLQATALVHEAYLRIVGPVADSDREIAAWEHRGHFFAAAAEAMRRILIDVARRKQCAKHGGAMQRITLEAAEDVAENGAASDEQLLAIDAALDEFERLDPQKAKLVKLRFFAGLSIEESAEALGISRATAVRHWAYARAWLFGRVREAM